MTERQVTPARIDWRDGRPRSRDYGDIYHAVDGMQESMQVFVGLNRLAQRFRSMADHTSFRIGELGFGTGLNFVCAAERFLADAPVHARLHFVSVEKHPLRFDDLRRAARLHPALRGGYCELTACYPAPLPGWHRLHLFGARVSLSLYYGDAREGLAWLAAAGGAPMDCWFLDGFAPEKNPQMWRQALFAELAALSHGATTLATFSAARSVRRALEQAGFRVERVSGEPRKRHLVAARFLGPRRAPPSPRTVSVIGAGIAGCCAAHALALRGHRVRVIAPQMPDGNLRSASQMPHGNLRSASENPAACLHPGLAPGSGPLARLRVKAFEHAGTYYHSLQARSPSRFWHPVGLAQLPGRNVSRERLEAIADALSNCHWLARADATTLSSMAGRAVAAAGLWLPRGGWLDLHAACGHLLAEITRIPALATELVARDGWRVVSASGPVMESDLLVIAAGPRADRLALTSTLPLAAVAGQITSFRRRYHGLRCVVSGDGYVAPTSPHHLAAGATYVREGHDALPDDAGRDANRARLGSMLGDLGRLEPSGDFAALRTTSRDRMPVVGTVASGAHVSLAHGSRGALTAPLAAEIIASQIDGEPPPCDPEEAAPLLASRFSPRST